MGSYSTFWALSEDVDMHIDKKVRNSLTPKLRRKEHASSINVLAASISDTLAKKS
jgi:hypothetical protein